MSYNGLLVDIARSKAYPNITYNQDINSGSPLGLGNYNMKHLFSFIHPLSFAGWLPTSVGGGVRSTSMNYLTSDILNSRPNIDILLGTRATTLTYTKSHSPIVNGVTVQQSKKGLPNVATRRVDIDFSPRHRV